MSGPSNSAPLTVAPLRPQAKAPVRATAQSAGYDLCAALESPLTIPVGMSVLVPTGLAIDAGEGRAAFVFARSGLAVKHGVTLSNGVGVIDADYRGEVQIGLINLGVRPYTVEPGERIAQLVLLDVCTPAVAMVQSLEQTGRGAGGFGSTGRR